MTNILADSQDIAEDLGLTGEDDEAPDLQATEAPVEDKMNFHVQMNGYTMVGFESAVIHAAARLLTDGRDFKKQIEAKAVDLALEKATRELQVVLANVMKTTAYVRGKETITLAEAIGIEGRSYLGEMVDNNGKISNHWNSDKKSRAQFLVEQFMATTMKKEIAAAIQAETVVIREMMVKELKKTIGEARVKMHEALKFTIDHTT